MDQWGKGRRGQRLHFVSMFFLFFDLPLPFFPRGVIAGDLVLCVLCMLAFDFDRDWVNGISVAVVLLGVPGTGPSLPVDIAVRVNFLFGLRAVSRCAAPMRVACCTFHSVLFVDASAVVASPGLIFLAHVV